ncbi:MAG TPA: AbrB/MazE/SpoVT family DNA-binding domain-containing protein [Sphingomonas sp.]|nr:AbrB/MazE/SpoVT family DNA-binding domain-containing protein [Sphingomonas sp.]
MGVEIKLSSKGQIVIPKDIRDALSLKPGETLRLSREGRRIVLEAPSKNPRERISYEEFRRRVPRYEGPPIAVEDMTIDFDCLWNHGDEHNEP